MPGPRTHCNEKIEAPSGDKDAPTENAQQDAGGPTGNAERRNSALGRFAIASLNFRAWAAVNSDLARSVQTVPGLRGGAPNEAIVHRNTPVPGAVVVIHRSCSP
jgi:hypothetical protein